MSRDVKAEKSLAAKVKVSKEATQPNNTEHHIRWIRLYFKPDDTKLVYDMTMSEFSAHGEPANSPNPWPAYSVPSLHTTLELYASGALVALAYCNIHGIWDYDLYIKVKE